MHGQGKDNKYVFKNIMWLKNIKNLCLNFGCRSSPIANSHCEALMGRNAKKKNLKYITKQSETSIFRNNIEFKNMY